MRIINLLFLSVIFLLVVHRVPAQQPADSVLRVTGVVVDQSSASAIPHVTIKNTRVPVAILTDSTGYFSVLAAPGDTLLFEAMAYQPDQYIVPESAAGGYFVIIELIEQGAVLLREITVRGRGFPTQQQFEQIFLQIDPGDLPENTGRLKDHIDETVNDETNMQKYILEYGKRQRTYWLSREGPPNDFLNPERWVEFIRDWRDGRFTDNAVEKLEGFPVPEDNEQE